jgi:hypothetical protein
MCTPNHLRDPKTRSMMVIGNLSLAVALLMWNFARPATTKTHGWVAGLAGLLLGLSIGLNLFTVRRARRCVENSDLPSTQ